MHEPTSPQCTARTIPSGKEADSAHRGIKDPQRKRQPYIPRGGPKSVAKRGKADKTLAIVENAEAPQKFVLRSRYMRGRSPLSNQQHHRDAQLPEQKEYQANLQTGPFGVPHEEAD
ncbi:MAG: hypothetical protein WA324_21540 [Bryobacteraceae bacterium]